MQNKIKQNKYLLNAKLVHVKLNRYRGTVRLTHLKQYNNTMWNDSKLQQGL